MKIAHVLAVTILACLVALAVSYLVGTTPQTASPAPVRAEAPSVSAGSVAEIGERLERIEGALSVLASRPGMRRPVETAETAESPADDPLAAALERIERLESELQRRTALGVESTRVAPLGRRAPADLAAIEALSRLKAESEEAVFREVRLMTPGEVIARFGAPSGAYAADGAFDMSWWYEHPNGTHFIVHFSGGYVLRADVSD